MHRKTGDEIKSTPKNSDVSFRALESMSEDDDSKAAYEFFPDRENVAFRHLGEKPAVTDKNEQQIAIEVYNSAKAALIKIFQRIKEDKDISLEPIRFFTKDFVSRIQQDSNPWLRLLYIEEKEEDMAMRIAVHSLNTAIVAIKIALGLKLGSEDLEKIALLAFCHDVGMLMVAPQIITKPGKLTPDEFFLLKKHPEHGYKILSKYEDLARSVYQEHERHDGSGYPNGLKNGDILDYSFIIGISDVYAAMVQPRPYRPRLLPFDAVKQIIAQSKGKFPPNMIKTLVNEFSVFPQGIYVKLNSREIGKVISTNKLAPLRPTIEIVYDAAGQKLAESKTVDMFKEHILQIKEAFFTEEEIDKSYKPER